MDHDRETIERGRKTDALSRGLKKPVVLIGMMSAGKTTIGRMLAKRLNLPFTDIDSVIEAKAGKPCSDIFAHEGEAAFRALEAEMVAQMLSGDIKIIATGGGAMMGEGGRNLILARSHSIWLRADVGVLAGRIGETARSRPMLNGHDPARRLADLADVRNPVYALADIAVDSIAVSPERTLDDVIDRLYDALHG